MEAEVNRKLLAAVDIGSNSVHLIVARVSQGALQTIQTYRERIQLAAGLQRNGDLDTAAFARGLDCLKRMGQILANYELDSVRIVATHTLRVARNRNHFISQAEDVLGYPIEVISGAEEARVIFLGVAHSLTLDVNTLVIDIGGGSTELAIGKSFEPTFTGSCAMGCVSFRDRYFAEGHDEQAFNLAQSAAMQQLEAFLPRLQSMHWDQVYATSGTAKALERLVDFSSDGSERAKEFNVASLMRLRELVIEKGLEYFSAAELGNDRLPLIPAGIAIMLALVRALNLQKIAYHDVALREGVLYELDEEMRHPDIVQRTRRSLHTRYQVDLDHAERVATTCQWLLDHAVSGAQLDRLSAFTGLLKEAAYLHEVGLQISAGGLQKHSQYILQNSDLPGFAEEQQMILAQLVGRYRKRLNFDELPTFAHLQECDFRLLTYILRLAVIFNVPRTTADLGNSQIAIALDSVVCQFDEAFLDSHPLLRADLHRERKYLAAAGVEFTF